MAWALISPQQQKQICCRALAQGQVYKCSSIKQFLRAAIKRSLIKNDSKAENS